MRSVSENSGKHGLPLSQIINNVNYQIKDLMNHNYTIVALVSYTHTPIKHYVWFTQLDQQDNIWAYDVYYGSPAFMGSNQSNPINYTKYVQGGYIPKNDDVFIESFFPLKKI